MRSAQVRRDGTRIRWVELPGAGPARVYLHGLGASSAAYYPPAVTHPALSGHRSLLLDLLGFGLSDRPTDFDYTLEGHADLVATAMTVAATGPADVIAHSMGGAVAIVLAARHPALVRRLVLVDANLDPSTPSRKPGGSGIATYTEAEFLTGGFKDTLQRVGPHWAATMRQAGPTALHRTAVHLAAGTVPTMRQQLLQLTIPRTFLYPAEDGPLPGAAALADSGVRVVPIPDTGHNIMLDNVDRFAHEVATALRAPAHGGD